MDLLTNKYPGLAGTALFVL